MRGKVFISLAFILLKLAICGVLTAQTPFRPFDCGMAVVSCFSGLQSLPPNPTINVNGPVMGIIDVRAHALAPP
ncbi:MAG: hypothetical protein NZM41_12310, partial [Saprospiraceae bacterium]|nr:hypothetical protein [Saprospiraceae bacterium]